MSVLVPAQTLMGGVWVVMCGGAIAINGAMAMAVAMAMQSGAMSIVVLL